MSHSARHATRRFALALALAASALAPGLTAHAAETSVAVVSLRPGAAVPSIAGVEVLRHHDAIDVVIVRATDRALAALRSSSAVSSLSADLPVTLTGNDSNAPAGVLASAALGPGAGAADAGRGVTVALVDTGVTDTPTLSRGSGRLVDGTDTSGEKTLTDGYGHGTAMANLIAGGVGSGGSAVGVAPAATILNVKVAGADGSTSLSKVVGGLDYVVKTRNRHSTDVLSISLSTSGGDEYVANPLTDAVDRVRDAGVVVVAAVGNTPGRVGAPAYNPMIVAVGAADTTVRKPVVADFSGSTVIGGAPRPDFVASGVGVLSVLPVGSKLARDNASTRRSDGYWRSSGTSQATAIAAGAAAITVQRFPSANVHEIRFSLMAASIPSPNDDRRAGAGLLRLPSTLIKPIEFRDGWRQISDDGARAQRPSWSSGSWSSGSWSSGSWSSGSWSSGSWSSGSWSSGSWSSGSWSSGSWSSGSWSSGSWSASGSWSSGSWSFGIF